MGDGAYDRSHVLDTVLTKNPTVKFIVPPCKGAMLGSTATTAPTQRNLHIRSINEHGRMNWQKASGYNRRPTKEQRNDRALASCGTAQDVIARYLRISTHTLRLHFRDELDTAAIKANQAMINNLFRIGSRGTGAARSLGHQLLAELPRSLAGVVIS